jgi:hypothetical protein
MTIMTDNSEDSSKDIETPPPVLEDKIAAFRQPMVTSTGIILGFVLNFASTLVREETPINEWLAWMVSVAVAIGVTCFTMVLCRLLKMDYPRGTVEEYYNRTLQFFVIGIASSFLGAFIQVYTNFICAQRAKTSV